MRGWARRLGRLGRATGPTPASALRGVPRRMPRHPELMRVTLLLSASAAPAAGRRSPAALTAALYSSLPLASPLPGVVPRLRPGRVPGPQQVGAGAQGREEGRGVRPGEARWGKKLPPHVIMLRGGGTGSRWLPPTATHSRRHPVLPVPSPSPCSPATGSTRTRATAGSGGARSASVSGRRG